jgi:hypothetical protein
MFWTGVSSTVSERRGMHFAWSWVASGGSYCWMGNAEEFVNCWSVAGTYARHGGGGKALRGLRRVV